MLQDAIAASITDMPGSRTWDIAVDLPKVQVDPRPDAGCGDDVLDRPEFQVQAADVPAPFRGVVAEFLRLGGHLVRPHVGVKSIADTAAEGWHLHLFDNDVVLPVCNQGQNRSQMAYIALQGAQVAQAEAGDANFELALPHGASGGFDVSIPTVMGPMPPFHADAYDKWQGFDQLFAGTQSASPEDDPSDMPFQPENKLFRDAFGRGRMPRVGHRLATLRGMKLANELPNRAGLKTDRDMLRQYFDATYYNADELRKLRGREGFTTPDSGRVIFLLLTDGAVFGVGDAPFGVVPRLVEVAQKTHTSLAGVYVLVVNVADKVKGMTAPELRVEVAALASLLRVHTVPRPAGGAAAFCHAGAGAGAGAGASAGAPVPLFEFEAAPITTLLQAQVHKAVVDALQPEAALVDPTPLSFTPQADIGVFDPSREADLFSAQGRRACVAPGSKVLDENGAGVEVFKALGGHVCWVTPASMEPVPGAPTPVVVVEPNDFVMPACHEGYNRSQIMYLVLRQAMYIAQGGHAGAKRVARPFGAQQGILPDKKPLQDAFQVWSSAPSLSDRPLFKQAFDEERRERLGESALPKAITDLVHPEHKTWTATADQLASANEVRPVFRDAMIQQLFAPDTLSVRARGSGRVIVFAFAKAAGTIATLVATAAVQLGQSCDNIYIVGLQFPDDTNTVEKMQDAYRQYANLLRVPPGGSLGVACPVCTLVSPAGSTVCETCGTPLVAGARVVYAGGRRRRSSRRR